MYTRVRVKVGLRVMVRVRVMIKVKVNVRASDLRRAWQKNNGKSVPCLTMLVLTISVLNTMLKIA